MNKNVEVVTLVYQSLDYMNFIANQLKSDLCKAEGWEVGVPKCKVTAMNS